MHCTSKDSCGGPSLVRSHSTCRKGNGGLIALPSARGITIGEAYTHGTRNNFLEIPWLLSQLLCYTSGDKMNAFRVVPHSSGMSHLLSHCLRMSHVILHSSWFEVRCTTSRTVELTGLAQEGRISITVRREKWKQYFVPSEWISLFCTLIGLSVQSQSFNSVNSATRYPSQPLFRAWELETARCEAQQSSAIVPGVDNCGLFVCLFVPFTSHRSLWLRRKVGYL